MPTLPIPVQVTMAVRPRAADTARTWVRSHPIKACRQRTSSVVGTSFIFFTATIMPVFLSRARHTDPYAPSPVRLRNSYFCEV